MHENINGKLFSAEVIVSRLALNTSGEEARRHAAHVLKEQMAQALTHLRMTEVPGDFQVAFQLRVYVFTPDELHELIQKEAIRLSQRPSLPF